MEGPVMPSRLSMSTAGAPNSDMLRVHIGMLPSLIGHWMHRQPVSITGSMMRRCHFNAIGVKIRPAAYKSVQFAIEGQYLGRPQNDRFARDDSCRTLTRLHLGLCHSGPEPIWPNGYSLLKGIHIRNADRPHIMLSRLLPAAFGTSSHRANSGNI